MRDGDRSVDVYVSKLRGKLETAMPDRRFIHTHPGFGYRFQPQPANDGVPAHPAHPHAMAASHAQEVARTADINAPDAAQGEEPGLSRDVHIAASAD